jgi:hypothetical protein
MPVDPDLLWVCSNDYDTEIKYQQGTTKASANQGVCAGLSVEWCKNMLKGIRPELSKPFLLQGMLYQRFYDWGTSDADRNNKLFEKAGVTAGRAASIPAPIRPPPICGRAPAYGGAVMTVTPSPLPRSMGSPGCSSIRISAATPFTASCAWPNFSGRGARRSVPRPGWNSIRSRFEFGIVEARGRPGRPVSGVAALDPVPQGGERCSSRGNPAALAMGAACPCVDCSDRCNPRGRRVSARLCRQCKAKGGSAVDCVGRGRSHASAGESCGLVLSKIKFFKILLFTDQH